MAWVVYFWVIAAFLVLPLPFKIVEYATGKDLSPRVVKIEEMANAAFFLVGLVGLYGFVYQTQFLNPLFWRFWIAIAIVVSIGGIFWSPKVRYGSGVLGKTRTRVIIGLGSLAFVPMLLGLYRYSSVSWIE